MPSEENQDQPESHLDRETDRGLEVKEEAHVEGNAKKFESRQCVKEEDDDLLSFVFKDKLPQFKDIASVGQYLSILFSIFQSHDFLVFKISSLTFFDVPHLLIAARSTKTFAERERSIACKISTIVQRFDSHSRMKEASISSFVFLMCGCACIPACDEFPYL